MGAGVTVLYLFSKAVTDWSMTLNYWVQSLLEILFKYIELLWPGNAILDVPLHPTKGVIIRLPKDLKRCHCHVFFEHEILTNTLKTKTLTFKVQLTFVPVSYGLFCGFERLEGEKQVVRRWKIRARIWIVCTWLWERQNVKRVAGLPPKVPLNMIEYLKRDSISADHRSRNDQQICR